jgi:hypothetical protein
MLRKLTLVVCALAVLAVPAIAFLGVGDVVYDPSNYALALQRLIRLEQQYTQMVQTYQMISNQYNQMLWMAQQAPVNMIMRYRVPSIPWGLSSATNMYGTSGNWITGINTGLGILTGYSNATQSLGSYGAALGNIPADQLSRIKTNYATVELTDAANLNALQTIGQLRANAPAVQTAIQGLEDDSLSSNPAMNTEVAVLNKINAANMVTVRNTQDTNKLLVALAEQQIVDAKRTRDAEAQAINNHIQFMAQGRSVMSDQTAGASSAMLAWRMP